LNYKKIIDVLKIDHDFFLLCFFSLSFLGFGLPGLRSTRKMMGYSSDHVDDIFEVVVYETIFFLNTLGDSIDYVSIDSHINFGAGSIQKCWKFMMNRGLLPKASLMLTFMTEVLVCLMSRLAKDIN
jgi:hypothetical protein